MHRRRRSSTWVALTAVALGWPAVAAGCGNDNALVGGECAPGYTECALHCVDLETDPENCGACGHACPAGVLCVLGSCGGLDATVETGADATSRPDSAASDGDTADGAETGGGEASSDASSTDAADAHSTTDAADAASDANAASDATSDGPADACTPPYNTVDHCGDCATRCVAPNDTCKPSDGGYACAPLCAPPLTNCGGTCVDTTSSPTNCGQCGKFCPSNLCANSVCQGSTPGDVVYIGHDYATTPTGTAQGRLVANAAFIAGTNPLRVLSYERYSTPAAVANVKAILNARAVQLGRTISYTATTTDGDIPSKLTATAYDVLLVPDQVSAPSGALSTLGSSWATTTAAFTKGGGVAVVLDGASGTGEMPAFASSAGLLTVTSHASLTAGNPVTVTAPSDVVGAGVLSPYGVWANTAGVVLPGNSTATVVVQEGAPPARPVVVHRVVP